MNGITTSSLAVYNKNDLDIPAKKDYKRKHKKKKHFRGIVRLMVICLFLILCVFVSKFMAAIVFDLINDDSQDSTYQNQYEDTSGTITGNEKEKLIEEFREQGYPESLVTLFEKHPETKEFVQDYPEYKNKKTAINLKGTVTKGEIPLFLQWDKRWGYRKYGGDFLAVTGCGPTCLSIVYCGLSGKTKWNPYRTARMAEKNGFYVKGSGSSWSLMTDGAMKMGLYGHETTYEKDSILKELNSGHPVICSVGPGDFTTTGHFIVLAGSDSDGNIIVRDPNSINNSNKKWSLDDIMPQIRNLWSYTL